jgi:protein phosphatase
MNRLSLQVHAATNPGRVRQNNEDCFLLAAEQGFFAVFDGMGGHRAGEVASRLARDVVYDYICSRRSTRPPAQLLERALQRACGVIYEEAHRRHERRGMGTTAVVCLVDDARKAYVAHVGDSRAYLLRESRLRLLTRDHTVVSELLARGAISARDAVNHPYKSVLSRNLGGRPSTQVDVVDVLLEPGDRLLLCSDGLTGFAAHDALEQVLGGAEEPRRATADLIDLAMRGGGGDNVTVLVIEAGRPQLPRTTMVIRTSGAPAWWMRRESFLEYARQLGVGSSPLCAVLSEDEAVDIVAGNLCEAIFHDLEQTTGIHVWTFTENLITGWLDQDGDYQAVRELLDKLREAAERVIADLKAEEEPIASVLAIAVLRAMVVAETAVAGAVADRIRAVEATLAREDLGRSIPPDFLDQKTIPRAALTDRATPPSPAVATAFAEALSQVRREFATEQRGGELFELCRCAQRAATDGIAADAMWSAREALGARGLLRSEVESLFTMLDRARRAHFAALKQQALDPALRSTSTRRLGAAYLSLSAEIASVVTEACQPTVDSLRAAGESTAALRAEVGRGEARLAELERSLARARTLADPDATLPE